MKPVKNEAIEIKYEELQQYDDDWNEELMAKKEDKYAVYIGSFLIWFSNLEHSLEIELSNLINERSHEQGYILIKDLEMFQKIELFYNLAFPIIVHLAKRKKQKITKLNFIKKELEELSVLRNKVAHAKWDTLDKDGYVRVDAKTDKINGLIKFRKFKISPLIMSKGKTRVKLLIEKLDEFVEVIYQ